MKEEIAAAVFFVTRLVKRYGRLDNDGRERFAAALTAVLFENYKNHWHLSAPTKGQAYRCLRMNRVCLQDPVLQQTCERSAVYYEDLGLPQELTVWVDPGEVSCRYGERSAPFCVLVVNGCRRANGEFSRHINGAVERASLDVQSGSSSDEEDGAEDSSNRSSSSSSSSSNISSSNNISSSSSSSQPSLCPASASPTNPEPKTIPTVSNPNSVYRFSEFCPGAPQNWLMENRNAFAGEAFTTRAPPPDAAAAAPQFPNQKGFKSHRATFTFAGPRVDKYHWVSKSRS